MGDAQEPLSRSCAHCRHWSMDDDPDGRSTCLLALNDPAARGWRTLPDCSCNRWEACNVKS
jgi:hypothetical protein